MERKKVVFRQWCILIFFLGSYLQFLVNIPAVTYADNVTEVTKKLIDTGDFNADAQVQEIKEGIQVTIHYQKAVSKNPKRIKLNIQGDENKLTSADLKNVPKVKMVESANQKWLQTEDFFSEENHNDLVFLLPKSTFKITVNFQIDQQENDSVQTDILTDKDAKSVSIQLKPESPDSSTLSTISSSNLSEEKTESQLGDITVPTTEASADLVMGGKTTQAPSSKSATQNRSSDPNDNIQVPTGNTISAIGLKLSTTSFANLKINVDNKDGVNISIRSKTNQLSSGTNYDQNSMMNYANGLYESGSSARVVVFDHQPSGDLKSVIQADYDTVGTVVSPSGEAIPVGAYVEVSNLHLRNSDWGGANAVGIDFSNNFYSGISLANIKYFDWKVIFYDTETHQPIDFETVDDNYAQLTFTSLNPGEFVNKFSTADNKPTETPIEDEESK